jgi:hypothetical protein
LIQLFAQTYKNYGLATVRYSVLEVTATVEVFNKGRGFRYECCGRASQEFEKRQRSKRIEFTDIIVPP